MHACFRISHISTQGRNSVREPHVVGVEEGDPIASRRTHAGVSGRADPAVRLSDDTNSTVKSRENIDGVVSRAVVHDNDLFCGHSLTQHTLDRLSYNMRTIKCWDDCRYAKHV